MLLQPLKGWDYAPLKEAFESLLAKDPPDPLLPKLRQLLAELTEVPERAFFIDLTTYWSESTTSTRCLGCPALRHESFEFPFPCSLISTFL